MPPDAETSASAHRSGFIAVVGRPNVGKSTLLNAYLGQKVAIVSPKPQTTRQTQLGILTRPDAQIIFVDTPGMHVPRNALGQFMVETAARTLQETDAILFIVDVSAPPGPSDTLLAQTIAERAGDKPLVLALNKSDVLKPEDVVSHSAAYRALVPETSPWMLVSATRGDNLDELLQFIIQALPEGPALYPEDEVTQTNLRDLAAELVREAALNALEQEVPHGLAVEVEEFQERLTGPTYIGAVVYVERESHKPIVIGRNAQMLKQIGSAARLEIEKMLEKPVYLELRVKVRKDWRKDEREVRRMGYTDKS
jgi:GTP-binding protein Era